MKASRDGHSFGGSTELADVGTGSKDSLAACNHHSASGIGGELVGYLGQARQQLLRQRIHLGVVQGDNCNAVVATIKVN